MRPTFAPGFDERENELAQDGFSTLSWLDKDKFRELSACVDSLLDSADHSNVHVNTPFRLSAFNNSTSYKAQIFRDVMACLQPDFDSLLHNYEPLVVNIFEKPPETPDSQVAIHQNPSFVEEPTFRTVSLWIPLCPVTKRNGTVGIMPRSHNKFYQVRAANMPNIFDEVSDLLVAELFQPIELDVGEAAVLDDSAIHWSYPNLSASPRVAVQIISVPKEAEHAYSYLSNDSECSQIEQYRVNPEFFFSFNYQMKPQGLELLRRFPYEYRTLSKAELLRECQ